MTESVDLRNGNLHVEIPDPGHTPETGATIRPLSRIPATALGLLAAPWW
jgi:hypothetical protein